MKNLGEQRAAIYEKTKELRPGSLEQKLMIKECVFARSSKRDPGMWEWERSSLHELLEGD